MTFIFFLQLLKFSSYVFDGLQVPLVLIQKIHTQTFSFINVQLFNRLQTLENYI